MEYFKSECVPNFNKKNGCRLHLYVKVCLKMKLTFLFDLFGWKCRGSEPKFVQETLQIFVSIKNLNFPTVKKWVWSLSRYRLLKSQNKHHQTILRPRKHNFRVLSQVTVENPNFQNCMRIAVLRKQLFARKSKNS